MDRNHKFLTFRHDDKTQSVVLPLFRCELDLKHYWKAGCHFMADVWRGDDIEVWRVFVGNLYQSWNLFTEGLT